MSRALTGMPPALHAGFCPRCQRVHDLQNDQAVALSALQDLFDQLESDSMFAGERAALEASPGKMIGVLVHSGGVLRAYSGELGKRRDWPHWVGPVLRREDTASLEAATLARISELDSAIEATDVASAQAALDEARVRFSKQPDRIDAAKQRLLSERRLLSELRQARRSASQALSTAMFEAATVTNARGERRSLKEVFVGDRIAGGTTDCCVPKLLEAANVAGIKPLGLAEAWWGPSIGGRLHGELQPPCERKCLPVMGYLLCDATAYETRSPAVNP